MARAFMAVTMTSGPLDSSGPPYPHSPELQPAERLWALTDATIANTWFESLNTLTEVLGEQCAWLETQWNLLTRHTLFHWWPLCRN